MKYGLSEAVWRRSSYSGGNSQCVEVADGFTAVLPVRDSKVPDGPCLIVGVGAWASFLVGVKGGRLSSE
ncbi:DUF397 domain-containing protein [Streptomyces griseoviridis]|uniref:DUF397 domain-containing protein n=1 Tax=Streptomyces TaxID=1883 RepID=UPI0024731DCC|nr:DUF397 domain-containing protein [Streptomyces sp. MAA16]MDH6699887.1 hypothetical protein [Streptomyces sp. MAA16]